jgi:hypothetical protein
MGAQGRGAFAGLHGQQCYVMQPLTVVCAAACTNAYDNSNLWQHAAVHGAEQHTLMTWGLVGGGCSHANCCGAAGLNGFLQQQRW